MFSNKLYFRVLMSYLSDIRQSYNNQTWADYLSAVFFKDESLGDSNFLDKFMSHIQSEKVVEQNDISDETLFSLFSFLLTHQNTSDGKLLIDTFDKAIGHRVNDTWTSPTPKDMTQMLRYFQVCCEEGIFSLRLFSSMLSLWKQPFGISHFGDVFYEMRCSKSIFTADNIILVVEFLKGSHQYELGWGLDHMREHGLLPQDNPALAQANFNFVMTNPARIGAEGENFRALFNYKLFNQANFEALMNHPHPGFVLFLAYGCRGCLDQSTLDLFFARPDLAEESVQWHKHIQYDSRETIKSIEELNRRIKYFEEGQAKKLKLNPSSHSPSLFGTKVRDDSSFEAEVARFGNITL